MNGYPTQQDYADAFGVELEEHTAEGGDGGEPGEPLGTESPAAAAVQDPAAQPAAQGAPEGSAQAAAAQPGEAAGEGAAEGEPPAMSAEERHAQAAARRAREQQAIEAASQARIDGVFASLFKGQVNPVTGQPIRTEADYNAYLTARQQQESTAQLERAGLDPQTIQKMVESATAPMRQELDAAKLELAQAKAEAVNRRAEALLAEAVENIARLYDPSVKSMQDITAMETAQAFNSYVQKGVPLEDAFYLANKKAIDERRAQAAYSRGAQAAVSRQHLQPVGQAGGEVVTVPKTVAAQYKQLFPDMTQEQMQKEYAQYLKELE